MDNILQIDKQILNTDKVICRHISNLSNSTRGEISQDILPQLRHFVEHIILKIYAYKNYFGLGSKYCPCEFKNFSKIINNQPKSIGKAEERDLLSI